MIVSMTGFARAESQLPAGSLVCELRSVNHRFLEVSLRLPDELRALEAELRATLQKELRRGKVDCTFTYRAASQLDRALQLDTALVGQLTSTLNDLVAATRASGVAQQINLVDLLRYPGVLREGATDPEAALVAGRSLFSAALGQLRDMRASEGARLKELVLTRCEQLGETGVPGARAPAGSACRDPRALQGSTRRARERRRCRAHGAGDRDPAGQDGRRRGTGSPGRTHRGDAQDRSRARRPRAAGSTS